MKDQLSRMPNLHYFISLPRRQKQFIAAIADYVLLTAAFWSALAIRFETIAPNLSGYSWQMLTAPLLAIPIFIRLGLYRAVIRFMEDKVVLVVVGGVSLSIILLMALMAFTHSTHGFSRGVLLIYWLLAILYIGATRFIVRSFFLRSEQIQDSRKRVAIYGAGRTGTQLAIALRAGRDYLPVLFFDNDRQIQKTDPLGLRVYSPSDLAAILVSQRIDEVLLAIPSASRARQLEIIGTLEELQCKIKIVPSISELMDENYSALSVRDIQIEDLLGRDAVLPDKSLLTRCVTGKSVLVSGAGGSIGSELCRQLIRLKPARLVLMELSEFALYSIHQELNSLRIKMNLELEILPLLGSVLHQHRNERIFKRFGIETIYHAAAYKHVPLVEHNPIEGLQNNVVGTRRMAEAALSAGVSTFVLISTDKAVRPTNVMGASKRLAELVLQGLAKLGGKTRFCMVRFGNVLGSSGSVVPLFRQQIQAGGPITLTHAEITRYFMTIPEAAQLVIQAGSMGDESAGGDVYVLDMGEPVKIIDLARRMIRLAGKTIRDENHPNGDIAILLVGLRPGEKLYEELLIGENVKPTAHPLIRKAHEHEIAWAELTAQLNELSLACQNFDVEKVLNLLTTLVKEYTVEKNSGEMLLWRTLLDSERGKST